MTKIHRSGKLEIDEDYPFQQRTWKMQRVGWVIMLLLTLAAVSGLFGSGPLSTTIAHDESGKLSLTHQGFARFQAPTQLAVQAQPDDQAAGELRLCLTRTYLEKVEIQHITPPPKTVEAGADRFIFVFRLAPAAPSITVVFYVEPEKFGLLTGRIGVNDHPPLHFTQFVYP